MKSFTLSVLPLPAPVKTWALHRPHKTYRLGTCYYGTFPEGFLKKVKHGFGEPDLHVCSGTVHENVTVDFNPKVRPSVVATADRLPFRNDSFRFALIDPPYDEEAYIRYQCPPVPTGKILREAVRVVRPGGRVGLLHLFPPQRPTGTKWEVIIPIIVAVNMRLRCFTIFRKEPSDAIEGFLNDHAA